MNKQQTGRTGLVTGGSRGIGAAIVRRLAADGAQVAFTYAASKDRAEELAAQVTAAGGQALAIEADNADPKAVQAAVARTVAEFGGLDILVNNAGAAVMLPVADLPLAAFDRMIAVNVRGAFTAVQAAVPHLGDGGRIIMIGSVNAHRAPYPGLSGYSASKAAVAGLTRALARELGPRGITVNNIQAGPTDTDMNPADGRFADMLHRIMPLGRHAEPADIASAVAYLASPEASFVTGTNWDVDGGFAV
ncbi:3-oxoacyl-ACP reductase family protein [Nocardioides sp. NPDC127503]|uniref:3-oxoacyl-ACP reductase family protein n=1 Tax=Nocardioides sp. NPDC127503 TaxID=3154516 RepID=UPI00331EA220